MQEKGPDAGRISRRAFSGLLFPMCFSREDMVTREPLSLIDAAWLRMDRPSNRMMIVGMMEFRERLAMAKVSQVLHARLLRFPRFLQRVAQDGAPAWEDDAGFDFDWHLRHVLLPRGMRLQDKVSELAGMPLDPDRPMWQFHVIDMPGAGSALVLRIHHCYGDGFALMHVVHGMTTAAAAGAYPEEALPSLQRGAWERIFGPASEALGDALRAADRALAGGIALAVEPRTALDMGRAYASFVAEAATIAAMAPDTPTLLKGRLGAEKRVTWSTPFSVDEAKAVARCLACSVNDLLLSCMAGALRTYLLDRGDALGGARGGAAGPAEIRALVPVDLRDVGDAASLGNHFGLVFLALPVHLADPYARLQEVHQRMERLKQSRQPQVAMGILAAMGVLPETMKERVLETLAANASAVISNVHGMEKRRFFAGKEIRRQVFWVPQSGGIGLGVSLLSYAGQIDIGVMSDVLRVPDPETIIDGFQAEFDRMLTGLLLAAWPARNGKRSGRPAGSEHRPSASRMKADRLRQASGETASTEHDHEQHLAEKLSARRAGADRHGTSAHAQ
ncbi:wax ester/triacylglycerol synthase family O-acyltransferase [Noviherbaspirillum galbum]|uniref:diacylglycerol O-acyltransferase n=1 Tax=Noviherbaspirillum galbum TaxID=2709383 RepID=A0A6B3SWV0_9BURK|nr:wax ester/triacylglycerol synthase family O-acyltransferase [Noviherbaspirillum galbum]NEX62902.1 wax ester/triacylglycerol synthase family O-acyltransferase [Noviherbaspirillum galbum]